MMYATIRTCGLVGMLLGTQLVSGCDAPIDDAAANPSVERQETRAVFRDPVERDIAAPELFDSTSVGIWDGRPTLGGVWIAHPLATRPERVRIINLNTEDEVTGAL
ncbi:MAG: SPOR domain-containing protein, partial [Pseudomonadota bacterium]